MSFVTALELATYLDGTTDAGDLTAAWTAKAEALLEDVSADVLAAAGMPLEAAAVTVSLPGTWGRDLELPDGPISEITSVTLNGETVDATGYWWNGRNTLRRGPNPARELLDDDDDDDLGGAAAGEVCSWGGPESTVVVVLMAGPDTVPAIVKALVKRIAARTIGNPAQITQESLGPYSVSYGASTNRNDGSHVTDSERRRLRKALGKTTAGSFQTRGRG